MYAIVTYRFCMVLMFILTLHVRLICAIKYSYLLTYSVCIILSMFCIVFFFVRNKLDTSFSYTVVWLQTTTQMGLHKLT